MSAIVAIGDTHQLEGFALAGVSVVVASSAAEYDTAWSELPDDTGLVILSPAAAETLQPRWGERPDVLTAVMP